MEPARSEEVSLRERCGGYPGCLSSPAAAVEIQTKVGMQRLDGCELYKTIRKQREKKV